MPHLDETPWGECLLEPREDPELERHLKAVTGALVIRGARFFLPVPWVAETMLRLHVRVTRRVHLDHDVADLAGLAVSQDNSCRYCYAAQRALLRILGFSEARILRIEQDFALSGFTPAQQAGIEFARRVSRASPLAGPREAEGLRRAGFSEEAIRELAAHAGLHVFFNRVATIAALPPGPMEALPDRWWARALRPALAPIARRFRGREERAELSESQRVGCYASVVNALDGLPLAADFRTILDAMEASPVVGPRCKALLFGVIARALGTEAVAAEAARLAAAEGASAAWFATVLDHLSAPDLTVQEAVLVPFARETVWYEPPRLQEKARALLNHLGQEELIEATAVVALANALCRVGAAVGAA